MTDHIDPVTKDTSPIDEQTEYDTTRVQRDLDQRYPGLLGIGCYHRRGIDMVLTECGYVFPAEHDAGWDYCPRCGRRIVR